MYIVPIGCKQLKRIVDSYLRLFVKKQSRI